MGARLEHGGLVRDPPGRTFPGVGAEAPAPVAGRLARRRPGPGVAHDRDLARGRELAGGRARIALVVIGAARGQGRGEREGERLHAQSVPPPAGYVACGESPLGG